MFLQIFLKIYAKLFLECLVYINPIELHADAFLFKYPVHHHRDLFEIVVLAPIKVIHLCGDRRAC